SGSAGEPDHIYIVFYIDESHAAAGCRWTIVPPPFGWRYARRSPRPGSRWRPRAPPRPRRPPGTLLPEGPAPPPRRPASPPPPAAGCLATPPVVRSPPDGSPCTASCAAGPGTRG